MKYVHTDETGRILALHETGHPMKADDFFLVEDAPEDLSYYIFKNGKFKKLSKKERLDIYFDGIAPEEAEALRLEEEQAEKELMKAMKQAFLKEHKGFEKIKNKYVKEEKNHD